MRSFLCLLILLAGLSFSGSSQTIVVGKSKSHAITWLKGDFRKLKYTLVQTDTSYTLSTNDTSISNVNVYCVFNKKGDCISQKIGFVCDSCYQKDLKLVLDRKSMKWVSISASKHLSKYSAHLLITGNDAEHYYIIKRIDIDEDEYKRLLSGKHSPAFAPMSN